MTARIYRPAPNAMQSGRARTKLWLLEYEPERPRGIDPLMGWTSSSDMRQQVQLEFDTKEEAIAYAEPEVETLIELSGQILARAQAAGVVRPDLTALDIPMLMSGVGASMGISRFDWRRHLELVIETLRARG